jgi:hypothetical protein
MRRRLPHEPKELLVVLSSWIEWRYAKSRESLVLTSAPTSLPGALDQWIPGAVWRLAWLGTGAAILYGVAPSHTPGRYLVVLHDAVSARREGTFEIFSEGDWRHIDGDSLEPEATSRSRDAKKMSSRSYRRRLLVSRVRARAVNGVVDGE